MRRNYEPFDGKRYLENTNTDEVHDLDNESPNCHIDEIKHEHICMHETLTSVRIARIFNDKINGCAHCLKSLDKG